MLFRPVPEDLVPELVRLGVVVDDETLVILGGLVHDRIEGFKSGEHGSVVFPDSFAVSEIGFSENEHVVDVRS